MGFPFADPMQDQERPDAEKRQKADKTEGGIFLRPRSKGHAQKDNPRDYVTGDQSGSRNLFIVHFLSQ